MKSLRIPNSLLNMVRAKSQEMGSDYPHARVIELCVKYCELNGVVDDIETEFTTQRKDSESIKVDLSDKYEPKQILGMIKFALERHPTKTYIPPKGEHVIIEGVN